MRLLNGNGYGSLCHGQHGHGREHHAPRFRAGDSLTLCHECAHGHVRGCGDDHVGESVPDRHADVGGRGCGCGHDRGCVHVSF